MLFKIAVLKKFTKFAGKHLCQSLFFNKVAIKTASAVKTNKKNKLYPKQVNSFMTEVHII